MRSRHLATAFSLALWAATPHPAAAVPKRRVDADTVEMGRAVEQLRQERVLAAGSGFYLRLDAGERRLALMLQGVALDDYPASALECGVSRVLFVDRRPPVDWDLASFSKGRLDPERERDRIEIVAPPVAAAGASESAPPTPPPVPPSAEEAYSVPSPYRIVFAEGISLEVRAKGDGRRNRSLAQRIADKTRLRVSDLASALGFGTGERVRLRVTLDAAAAASLYRSLPPNVSLIVVGLRAR